MAETERVERDPTGRDAHEMGAKMDDGKVPVCRGALDYFPRALKAVARISEFGARKYAWKSWETVPDAAVRYRDALGRHLLAEAETGPVDRDSGHLHLAHLAWNALALLEMAERERERLDVVRAAKAFLDSREPVPAVTGVADARGIGLQNVRIGGRLNRPDPIDTYVLAPLGSGPCAKQTVTATVVAKDGRRFVATNHTMNPQRECPRAGMPTGEGYEKCRDICKQPGHAEVNAVNLALHHCASDGATLYLEGHTYACDECQRAARDAGIAAIVIGPPPRADESIAAPTVSVRRVRDAVDVRRPMSSRDIMADVTAIAQD